MLNCRKAGKTSKKENSMSSNPPGARKSSFDLIDSKKLFSEMGMKKGDIFLDLGCGRREKGLRGRQCILESQRKTWQRHWIATVSIKEPQEKSGRTIMFPCLPAETGYSMTCFCPSTSQVSKTRYTFLFISSPRAARCAFSCSARS